MPLQDSVALVTGASSGIGAATARRLAAEGAAVALVARRRDKLEELARTIGGDSRAALVLQADVASGEEAAAAVDRTVAELGRLDILVNNAGVMLLGPALDAPVAEWEQMIDVNVRGVLNVTHAALPHLVRAATDSPRRVADLVTISSTAGPSPTWSPAIAGSRSTRSSSAPVSRPGNRSIARAASARLGFFRQGGGRADDREPGVNLAC